MDELIDFLKAKETDPRRLQVIGLHVQARNSFPLSGACIWLCQLCLDDGQNFDCTYPCDFLRVYGERFADDPDYRDHWRP